MSDKFQYLGGGSGTYLFWILDQRRYFAVRGSDEVLTSFEYALDILNQCADDLLPSDIMVEVSDDEKWLTMSNKDSDDQGRFFRYPRFDVQEDDVRLDIVKRSDLQEENRMYWLADIVSYVNCDTPSHRAVFKIAVHSSQLHMMWKDAHIARALKGHPSIVPFEKFVVDDTENRLVGWTSTFIPGGTLEDNHSSTYFRLSWLTQMTEIIDDLNLKYGIMHRDIAARNFLIDPQTKRLLLFDFNNGMQIGDPSQNPKFVGPPDVDGVIFTIYELLTHDKSFREGQVYWQHDVTPIEEMAKWPVKAELEPGLDVTTIRRHLSQWVERRRTERTTEHFAKASHAVVLPKFPEELDRPMYFDEEESQMQRVRSQGEARMAGVYYVDWKRPPYQKVPIEYYVPTLALVEADRSAAPEKD
jgi:hypothetical protein